MTGEFDRIDQLHYGIITRYIVKPTYLKLKVSTIHKMCSLEHQGTVLQNNNIQAKPKIMLCTRKIRHEYILTESYVSEIHRKYDQQVMRKSMFA